MILAEILEPEPTELGRAILSRLDVAQLEALAVESGMISLRQRAREAIEAGLTSPPEVTRVLGLPPQKNSSSSSREG